VIVGAVKDIHLLRDVNFNLPVFSTHCEIWYRGCPQKFMECYDFVSVCSVKSYLGIKGKVYSLTYVEGTGGNRGIAVLPHTRR